MNRKERFFLAKLVCMLTVKGEGKGEGEGREGGEKKSKKEE